MAHRRFGSVDDFVDWEERQPERYEFFEGQVWPMEAGPTGMAGGTLDHNEIAFNIRTALTRAYRGRDCRVFSENVKLKTAEFSAYPDVLVICRPVAGKDTSVAEAEILVEILSEGTETRDRSVKLRNYLALPGLRHYVLVSQEARLVEVYTRREDGWAFADFRNPDAAAALPAAGIEIALAEIYAGTGIPPYRTIIDLTGR